ncbi:anaphase-promoting complex, cyclosome, subunit 4-domain-containing protein [Coniochaeta sp. 2T2.1]|nr:anaphase-promoting complex, cyclosome, subunit 4-domain-containing protein [Coniochaeta sp. 2T2.1]
MASSLDQGLELQLFSESSLSHPVSARLLACNPTVDLLATGSDANVLNIWRAHGQLVAKHVERTNKLEALRWKPDGQFLAAGWSDGVLRLVGFENAKAAHQIAIADKGQSRFAYIAWSRNRIAKRGRNGSSSDTNSWARLLNEEVDSRDKEDVLDLPTELTFIEVDTALPKLSPLPVSGGSGTDMLVFTTRNAIDFIFRPFKAEDARNVDVTIVGMSDGRIQISIYDSFMIGGFQSQIPNAQEPAAAAELCCHSSHPELSTHALLFKPQADTPEALYLVPVDLTFIHSSPINLSLLASKTTTLQNILRYIKQTQVHMVGEWKSTRELPGRFMAGVQDDLQKLPKCRTIVQALYHTVVTGHVYEPVKEWLVDSLAERGHKRWDKAVTSGLENLRALVHENMIPALQRAIIILSRLRGIARFEERSSDIGFTAAQIAKLIDIVQTLYAVSYKVLRMVMKELVLFAKFSSWLRLEIDKLASSTMTDELLERQANVDCPKVLKYIKDYLTTSPMSIFFDDVDKADSDMGWSQADDGVSLREMLETQVKRHQAGQPYLKAVPKLDFLVDYITSKSAAVLKAIAETQRRRVRIAPTTKLELAGGISRYDIRLCPQKKTVSFSMRVSTPWAFAKTLLQGGSNVVRVFRTQLEIINGISRPVSNGVAELCLPGGRIVDFKFIDERSLLVLWRSKGATLSLWNIPFQALPYKDYASGTVPEPPQLDSEQFSNTLTSAGIPSIPGFVPVHMEVVGASSQRGEIPARVCLLGKDRTTYKVYALPKNWEPRMDILSEEDMMRE